MNVCSNSTINTTTADRLINNTIAQIEPNSLRIWTGGGGGGIYDNSDWLSISDTHNNRICSLETRVKVVETDLNNLKKEKEQEQEETKSMSMFNFNFGKVTSDAVRLSMYGIAIKNIEGRYVSYDTKSHSVMDVEIMNMAAGDFLYKMPVAIKDIKAGDVVVHNRAPMFVVESHESTLKVIDIREGMEKEIYLTKSPFGFNFATKVISLMDMCGAKADESNPFGNMLPFLMLGDGKNVDPLMIMLACNGKMDMDMSNPMMMYFLMKDNKSNDNLFPLFFMNSKGISCNHTDE